MCEATFRGALLLCPQVPWQRSENQKPLKIETASPHLLSKHVPGWQSRAAGEWPPDAQENTAFEIPIFKP